MEAIYNKIGKTNCPLLDLVRLNKQTNKTYIFLNSSVSVGQILLHLNCLVFLKSIMFGLETKPRRLLIIKEQGGEEVQAKKQNAALHSLNGCIVKSHNVSTMERWSGRPAKSRHDPFSPFLCPSASSQILYHSHFYSPFYMYRAQSLSLHSPLIISGGPLNPPVFGAQKGALCVSREGRAHALSFSVLY